MDLGKAGSPSPPVSRPSFIQRAFDLYERKPNTQLDAIAQAATEFEIDLPKSYLEHPGVQFHRWRGQGYRSSNAQPNQPGVQPTSPSGHQVDTEKPELVDCAAIVERLIVIGAQVGANELVFENDPLVGKLAKEEPFAFLLAASVDRGMKAETAWRLPAKMKIVLGHLDPSRIARMSVEEMLDVLKSIEGRPRYLSAAAQTLIEVATRVVHEYEGDARNLWKNQPAVTINQRMQQVHGVGPGIAAMVVILLDKLKVVTLRPEDYAEMDPKPDVHVQRVFSRLGLCERSPTERDVIQAARRLHPSYPGKLDGPSWHIGRTWCHSERPDCPGCPMSGMCPKLI